MRSIKIWIAKRLCGFTPAWAFVVIAPDGKNRGEKMNYNHETYKLYIIRVLIDKYIPAEI